MRLIVVGDCVALKRKTHPSSSSNGTDKSVDRKGIKRGACQERHCSDCDAYIYNPAKGSQCQYCGCYPTKHRRIDDETIAPKMPRLELKDCENAAPEIHIIDNGSDTLVYEVDDEGNVVPDDSPLELLDDPSPSATNVQVQPAILKNNAILSNCASVAQPAPSTSSFSKSPLLNKEVSSNNLQINFSNKSTFEKMVQQMSQEQLYEFCVPSRLPMRINFPRDSESLTKSDAEFIVKWIAWSMWNLGVTSEQDFVHVANLSLKRYPALESILSIFSNEKAVDGMVNVLKQFLGHRAAEKKKKELEKVQQKQVQQKQVQQKQTLQQKSEKENAVTNLKQYETVKSHIYKEMEKLNPSIAVLRTFLSSCRKERKSRLSTTKQDYSTQLQEFPCLRIQEVVLWEFISQEQLQCTGNDLKKRWLDAIPTMASYFLSESEKTYDSPLTEEEATVEILQCLTCPTHFGSVLSEENDRSHLVLEVFKGNIMPLYVFPAKHDPPRLFSLGDDEDQTTYVYVEGKAVFKGAILDALLYIVAIYFVFDFSPSPEASAAFSFIYGILMKDKAFEKYMVHKPVTDALAAVWASQ